jgi:hypothetical protein
VEPAVAQAVDLATLAVDDRDECAVSLAHERDEWSEVKLGRNPHRVGNRAGERERLPQVVQPGREDGQPANSLPVEVLVEVTADPLEVRLQTLALVVGELGPPPAGVLSLVEERVGANGDVPGRRSDLRIEVEVEADRASGAGAERGQLPQLLPTDGGCYGNS